MSRLFLRLATKFFSLSSSLLDKAEKEAGLEVETADKVIDTANRVRSEALDRQSKAKKLSDKIKELLS